ncbi:glycosyltransferase, partial [Escherichia coli]|nr:glycosyltransferase [Escherichia coli]
KYAENSSGDVKIFNFNDNLGIAEAQSIGMKWAFENGADFILQMDQDSIPDPKMVEQLLTCYKKLLKQNVNVGLVGSQDFDKVT